MGELVGDFLRLGFLLTLWAFGIWVGGASVAAWVAWEKGREPVAWFVLAFFLSPLVALVALSAVPAVHLARRRAVRGHRYPLEDPMTAAARLVNALPREEKRWDVATSAATTTKEPW
ncbi:MAG TPA: hypothetical protein VLK35_07180 [Methylomirabilota bacterium]|nr:hypothetical protein [Methylomirabilota bacterium]